MLVLGRELRETVTIDTGKEKIIVTFTELKGAQICLGFDAPKHVAIYRSELAEGREWEKRGRR